MADCWLEVGSYAASRETQIGPGGSKRFREKKIRLFQSGLSKRWGRAETKRFLNENRADRLRGVSPDLDTPRGVEK